MAIITPALGAARTSLNRRFPNRDKASDGWIGDRPHAGTRSGHNPDETGNAEYQDSDSIDEVRAVDLDADLRESDVTMQDVVNAILATPRDRDRCSYLIYNGRIWSRSAGYIPREYTGANDHSSHLHLSGRPVNDNDDRPWLSIENVGDDMPITNDDVRKILRTDGILEAPAGYSDKNKFWTLQSVLRSTHLYSRIGFEMVKAVREEVEALSVLMERILTTPAVDLTPEQVTTMVQAVRAEVARPLAELESGLREAGEVLATIGEVETEEDRSGEA